MRVSLILASLWLCVSTSAALAHGSLNFKGSEGGIVHALVTASAETRVVYAATSQSGIFKSIDGGKHWAPANKGMTRMDVLALVLDPKIPTTLYAGTRRGLFKTTDGGAAWQEIRSELSKEQIKALVLDPDDAKTLYAGTYHGLWKSSDAGVTWLRLASQPENSNITTLAIARDALHSIYAGTAEGLFRSRDAGVTWTRSSKGLTVPAIATLAVDPTRPQTLYTGTGDGAYKSEDGADTWNSITFKQTNLPVTALLVDPRHPDTLYMGTSFVGGFFKTEDGGKSWVRIQGDTFTPSITALIFSPGDTGGLVAGTSFYSNVFTSPDAGMTWKSTPDELALPILESISGTPDGEFLFAAAQDGLYRFNSAQETWKRMSDAGVGTLSKVAYSNGKAPVLWVCGAKGIAEGQLKNNALTFKHHSAAQKGCVDLALDAQSGHVLAVTKTDLWVGPGRWQQRVIQTQGEPIHQMHLGKDGKHLYVLTAHHALRSTDEGRTWERMDKNGSFVFTAVAETGTEPATTWIATSSDISYRMSDGKWVNTSQGMFPPGVGAITSSSKGDKIYAASQILGRVFARKANEDSWSSSDIEEGAPDISDLWIDPTHEGVMYAATRNSGLFRSSDQGLHWRAVNGGLEKKESH